MAIFCLSKNEEDFLNRVEDITIAYSLDNKPIFVKDLNCRNAIRYLIKDDLKPNLVQTKYGTPTFVHGGLLLIFLMELILLLQMILL